ncbi:unnamed protein product, partial [Amoebophrya sp. A120]
SLTRIVKKTTEQQVRGTQPIDPELAVTITEVIIHAGRLLPRSSRGGVSGTTGASRNIMLSDATFQPGSKQYKSVEASLVIYVQWIIEQISRSEVASRTPPEEGGASGTGTGIVVPGTASGAGVVLAEHQNKKSSQTLGPRQASYDANTSVGTTPASPRMSQMPQQQQQQVVTSSPRSGSTSSAALLKQSSYSTALLRFSENVPEPWREQVLLPTLLKSAVNVKLL